MYRDEFRRFISPVNTVLILINVGYFIYLTLAGNTQSGNFLLAHGGNYAPYVFEDHEYWRLLTAMFMHAGVMHLFNNMIVMAFVGANLERAVGKVRFVIIYFMSGILSNLFSAVLSYKMEDYAVGVGASGAIFGVVGALLWIVILHRGVYEDLTMRQLVLFIILSVYLGVQSSVTDNVAHVAGLIVGLLLCLCTYGRWAVITRRQ